MNRKTTKFRKLTIGVIATMLTMSTIVAAIPANVKATADSVTTGKPKLTNLKRTSENLIDSSFSDRSKWTPIYWTNANGTYDTYYTSWGTSSGNWQYFSNGARSVQFPGNGTTTLRSSQLNACLGIGQSFPTVPGHRYRITYSSAHVGGLANRFDVVVNNGSTIYHHLANPAPIWSHVGTAFGWGTAGGTRTGEFTAPSNSASITLETMNSSVQVSGLSIVDLDAMNDTTIDALTSDSERAQGTAEANASLTIKAGSTTIATSTVGSDGTYNVAIPKQAAGTTVTATATAGGQSKSASTTVTQGNIAQTTINSLTTDSVKAEGTAEPGATLVIKDQNNAQLANGTVGANGTYSLTIPTQAAGTIVTATATKNGKTSSASTTVSQAAIAQTTINGLTTDSIKAEGTAEPGATLIIRNQNNTQLATGTVQSDGTYSFTIPKQLAGMIVTATATKNSKISIASTIVVQGEIAQTTINALTTDSEIAQGTAEPNANLAIKVGDTTLISGRVGSDGNYSFTIPKQTAGTIVTATATLGGKTSNANTTVTRGSIVPTTINALTTDSVKAEGTAEPNANLVIKDQNHAELATGRVGSDGNYSMTIAKQPAGTIVTATATKDGKESSASTTVVTADITQTTINALTTESTAAQGTAEPNASLAIKVGDTTLATGRVGSDGNYSVTIPKQPAGTVVTATATKDSKTSSASTTVIQDTIAQTTINPLNTDSIQATGTAEPNATIVLKDQNNNQLATGRVGSDGNYSLTISKQIVGTIVTATATANGKTSSATTIVTNDRIAQTTINSLTTDSTQATGTAEPNATIVLKDQNDNQLATGRVGSDGMYSLTIPKQLAGTIVTATATANGKTSSANTTVVSDSIAQTIIYPLTTDSTQATGTAEPNANIVIKDQNNTELATGRVASDGTYRVTIPKQSAGTIVTATATAGGKTSSASTTVTSVATGTVVVKDAFYVGYDSRIQAEVTGDITKVYLEVDGVKKSTIPVSGSFEYYARDVLTSTNQTAYLVGQDSSNRELDRTQVILKDGQLKIGSITPNNFVVGVDAYVRGTYTGSVAKVALSVNGTVLSKVAAGTDGTFQYYARPNITNAETDVVYAIGYNSENLEIARTRVTLTTETAMASTTISPLTTDSVKAEGTAEPNADIVIKDQNNTELASGKVGSDGNYSLTIPKQAVGAVITATATLNGKTSSASTTVTQGNLTATTIRALTTDSVKAEGTAEPNASLVIKAGQTTLASGTVGSDGNYSLTIAKQAVGTVVTATATKNGQTSSASTTVTQGDIAQTTIGALTTNSTTVQGNAEPSATIVIKDQGNNQLASGVVGEDGTYVLTISKQPFGAVVTATATAKGKTSSASTTVTQDTLAQTTLNALNTNSTKAEGTAEPNADLAIKVGSTTIATGKADASGRYSITIPNQAAGTVVTATATKNGETSSANVTVTQAASGTVVVKEDYYVGYDSRIKAEATGDVAKVYLEVDGVRKTTIPVTGNFEYYAKNDITSTTQTVYLVGLSATNNELDRARVTLKDGQLKIGTVSPDSFIVGVDAYVKGTYTGSVKKVGLSVNGTILTKIPVGTDGTFQYYARPNITDAETDEVYVIGYNSENDEISRKKVTLYGPDSLVGTLTVNPNYFAVSTDSYVQGTYTGNVKYVSLVVNGTEYVKTPVKDATTWSYYSKGKIALGDTVTIKAYNGAGVVVDEETVNVVENPPGESTVAANDFVLYQDKYVTGTYTGNVKYVALKVNGTVLNKIAVAGGSYSYYARPNITSKEDVVSVIAYNGASSQVAEAPVAVKETQITSEITANNFTLGDSSIVGTYSGDVAYISATVNDVELSKIPVDGTNTYTYYIKRFVTNDQDEIIMKAYNGRSEVVATANVRINPTGDPVLTTDPYTVGTSSYVTGTYGGGVKYIALKVNGVVQSKIPANTGSTTTYQYYAKSQLRTPGMTASMIGYDGASNAIIETPITVQ
ncbi:MULTISPECIES: immunoglobulin-like domain-containing protein [Listeria]|uniref:immunoglobulin-like domain-containing protein n=1 Tax=Listeria TaxID=1637 RepID=UPI000B5946FB|nr:MULTISPECIES: immunoglobulin-like domain-containing protein [Listeria]